MSIPFCNGLEKINYIILKRKEYKMNKTQFVNAVAEASNISKKDAAAAVYAVPTSATVTMNQMSSSDEIDELLNELDAVVTKYVAAAKKAQNGDTAALIKMTTLTAEYAEILEKLTDQSDDMTPTQLARYTAIVAKMAEAAQ